MSVQSYLGATLEWADGSQPATEDASGYGALSFAEIENVITVGEIADGSEDITYNLLKEGRTQHVNGVKDMGEISVTCAYDASNAAAIGAVEAKNNSNTTSSFKLTDSSGAITYFQGRIANFGHPERSASAYEGRTFVIRPTSGLVTA